MQFGSHIYGTNTPTSDHDYKGVFVPNATDLILQRADRNLTFNTKSLYSHKNTPDDIDEEYFSLQEFLKQLCDGQTFAIDMLFAPDQNIIRTCKVWETIRANKDKFIHKGTSAFVGYTRAQAAKYGVKGFRVAALRAIIDMLSKLPPMERIEHNLIELEVEVEKLNNGFVKFVDAPGAEGRLEKYLEVCGRKVNVTGTIQYALNVFKKVFDNYGQRALLAEKNEGIDWKALSHAVRVAREAEELLLTGNITFPRPERDLLLKIKKGEIPYKEVEKIIEEGLIKVEHAKTVSRLPEKPDIDFVNKLVYDIYLEEIKKLNE